MRREALSAIAVLAFTILVAGPAWAGPWQTRGQAQIPPNPTGWRDHRHPVQYDVVYPFGIRVPRGYVWIPGGYVDVYDTFRGWTKVWIPGHYVRAGHLSTP